MGPIAHLAHRIGAEGCCEVDPPLLERPFSRTCIIVFFLLVPGGVLGACESIADWSLSSEIVLPARRTAGEDSTQPDIR